MLRFGTSRVLPSFTVAATSAAASASSCSSFSSILVSCTASASSTLSYAEACSPLQKPSSSSSPQQQQQLTGIITKWHFVERCGEIEVENEKEEKKKVFEIRNAQSFETIMPTQHRSLVGTKVKFTPLLEADPEDESQIRNSAVLIFMDLASTPTSLKKKQEKEKKAEEESSLSTSAEKLNKKLEDNSKVEAERYDPENPTQNKPTWGLKDLRAETLFAPGGFLSSGSGQSYSGPRVGGALAKKERRQLVEGDNSVTLEGNLIRVEPPKGVVLRGQVVAWSGIHRTGLIRVFDQREEDGREVQYAISNVEAFASAMPSTLPLRGAVVEFRPVHMHHVENLQQVVQQAGQISMKLGSVALSIAESIEVLALPSTLKKEKQNKKNKKNSNAGEEEVVDGEKKKVNEQQLVDFTQGRIDWIADDLEEEEGAVPAAASGGNHNNNSSSKGDVVFKNQSEFDTHQSKMQLEKEQEKEAAQEKKDQEARDDEEDDISKIKYGVITRWSGGQGVIESSTGRTFMIESAADFSTYFDVNSISVRGAVVEFYQKHKGVQEEKDEKEAEEREGKEGGENKKKKRKLFATSRDFFDSFSPAQKKFAGSIKILSDMTAAAEAGAVSANASVPLANLPFDLTLDTESIISGSKKKNRSNNNNNSKNSKKKNIVVDSKKSVEGEEGETGTSKLTQEQEGEVQEGKEGKQDEKGETAKTEGQEEGEGDQDDEDKIDIASLPVRTGVLVSYSPAEFQGVVKDSVSGERFLIRDARTDVQGFEHIKKQLSRGCILDFRAVGSSGRLATFASLTVLPNGERAPSIEEAILDESENQQQSDGGAGKRLQEEAVAGPMSTSYWVARFEKVGANMSEWKALANQAFVPGKMPVDAEGVEFPEDLRKSDPWFNDSDKNRKIKGTNARFSDLMSMNQMEIMGMSQQWKDPAKLQKKMVDVEDKVPLEMREKGMLKAKEWGPKYLKAIKDAQRKGGEPVFNFQG